MKDTVKVMTVGIVGLGLIGGSLAKAYKAANHKVLVCDTAQSIEEFAIISGAADGKLLTDGNSCAKCEKCDLILIALYPNAAVEFLNKIAASLTSDTTVIDCCGTKKNICDAGFALAKEYGFTFVGGHPMAGKEQSGFKHSCADLFKDATFIMVPPVYDDMAFLDNIKSLLSPAGFGRITVTTAEEHDRMVAFTSQMAHLVSNAFIKSPTVLSHKGFSAGSYKDLTRVAWLNENMWAELFIENRENLLNELGIFISSLERYRDALQARDSEKLRELLSEGKKLKEKVDRQNK